MYSFVRIANYNQYGGDDPQLIQQLCQTGLDLRHHRGLGPSGWYYNEAETDFWQVWHSLASSSPWIRHGP